VKIIVHQAIALKTFTIRNKEKEKEEKKKRRKEEKKKRKRNVGTESCYCLICRILPKILCIFYLLIERDPLNFLCFRNTQGFSCTFCKGEVSREEKKRG